MCKHLKSNSVDLFVQMSDATKVFYLDITVSKMIFPPGGIFPMGDGKNPR